jgi:hypothetical protein
MGGTICNCATDETKMSKALLNLPWFVVNRILASVDEAETRKGSPPNAQEIFVAFEELGNITMVCPVDNAYAVCGIVMSMLREHMLYTDKVAYLYSRKKHEGFYTYAEIFAQKFPGYCLASDQSMIPLEGTLKINFDKLWSILRSKDRAVLEQNKAYFDGNNYFLDGSCATDN